jgi:gliding motility-associated-like protein
MAKKIAAPTCVSSTRTPVSVIMNPLPIPLLTSSDPDNKFCIGTSITFTAQGGTNYNFRVGGSTAQNGASSTFITSSLLNGQVVDVIVTNSNNCSATSSSITNTVYDLPVVTFGGTLAAQCVSSTTYTLTGGSPSGGVYSGPGVSGTNFNASVAGVGTHTITYTYTNTNGCSSSATKTITVNALPVVTFSGALAAQCVSSTVYTLTGGSPSGGTYSGAGVTGTNFNASVAGVGTHTITYSYTNSNGCTNSATNTITVNALPVVTFVGTLTAQCVSSTTYALSGGSPVGGTYSGPGVAGTNFNASLAGVGTHTITYSFTSASGCTNTATNTITVYALPTVTFSGTLSAQCASSTTYTLTGGSPAGGTYSGPGVTGTNFNASVAGVGTHTITYSFTNGNGCTSSATKSITVNALPTVTFTGILAAQCLNSTTYTLTGGSPAGGTYSGLGVTGTNFNASVAGAGTHTITYSYTNANGCTNSASNTITVNTLPVPTLTSSDADNTFCAGTSVTFTAGGGSNYNFRIGGVSVQNGTSNTYSSATIANNQVVDVVVTNSNGCAATSAPITNTVIQVPAGNAGTGGNECDLDFVLNAVPSIGTGTWTFTTTSPGSATFNPNANTATATVSVTEPGTYYFTWTEINNICSKSSTITVNFYRQPAADAGKGGNNCGPSRTLGAIPSVGTGTWTKSSGPGTVTFSPNANNPKAIASVSAYGLYNFTWTEVNGTCSSSDTINVNFLQVPSPHAGADASECDLDHIMAAVQGTGAGAGLWSLVSGPGTAVFTPSASVPGATVTVSAYGTYVYAWTEINGTCFATDQVSVVFRSIPPVNAGRDTVKCLGNNLRLQATGTGTFRWTPAVLVSNPNISNPVAINIDPANYVVTLTDQYDCKNSDTVFVDVWDTPFSFAGADTTLDYIFTLKLDADEPDSNETGTWSTINGSAIFDDPKDPKTRITNLSVGENIILWTVSNGICPDFNDYVTINVNNLVVPSLITPNGDQNNEYFRLQGIETLGKTELIIFDRRGIQVWKSDNYENDWNGIDHNGKTLPEDTYYYTLRAQNGVSMSGYIVIRR